MRWRNAHSEKCVTHCQWIARGHPSALLSPSPLLPRSYLGRSIDTRIKSLCGDRWVGNLCSNRHWTAKWNIPCHYWAFKRSLGFSTLLVPSRMLCRTCKHVLNAVSFLKKYQARHSCPTCPLVFQRVNEWLRACSRSVAEIVRTFVISTQEMSWHIRTIYYWIAH